MVLYLKDRSEWRRWLEKNHSSVDEVWLIFYKKISGRQRIPYVDAVEEALCFGWIDGKLKRVNEDYYIQRFTPRRPGSRWSKLNLSRVSKLIDEGRMSPDGMKAYKDAKEVPQLFYDIKSEANLTIPDDLMEAFKNNPVAYSNFANFPPSNRKLYVFWLNNAKRAETRKSRIRRIVDHSEKNLMTRML